MKQIERFLLALGFEKTNAGHKEKIIAACGGFFGVAVTTYVSHWWLSADDAVFLSFSMGAAAILLFAVPHSPLSQPWPLVGGNVISALVGVLCFHAFAPVSIAAALAVGISLLLMYYLRCLHPPGGATAMIAVLGGSSVHDLGFQFVLTPVLLNAMILLVSAIVFNYFFPWRRYPTVLVRYAETPTSQESAFAPRLPIDREDISYALSHSDSFIDINEDDLERLFILAHEHRQSRHLDVAQLRLGGYYQNGDGDVRRIIDESGPRKRFQEGVVYRVIAGKEKPGVGYCKREEFAKWAMDEVVMVDGKWNKIDITSSETK